MVKFEVYEVALLAVGEAGEVLEKLNRLDSDLARQMRRAVASVPLNIAEGNARRGKDRAYHFRVAAGSAREVLAAVDTAVAFGYFEDARELREYLDRVCAMLFRLT